MCGGGALRPYRIRLLTEGSSTTALAEDLAAHGLVFTRGTPPRTEGCRTAGRGLVAVTHDLTKNVRDVIAAAQLLSGYRNKGAS
ncbi:hypothetical protein GCM10017771_15480 [Streptomyces capitiformicae]|uniref:Uncharacterized protein n=1 Tax=Streptomyces capitiformicae TaxID=2014920 RepID=A0A919GI75_9ACTN|nr:hypothetical protein GCM10017771_15480 [Streptomyces capitiformicae]